MYKKIIKLSILKLILKKLSYFFILQQHTYLTLYETVRLGFKTNILKPKYL